MLDPSSVDAVPVLSELLFGTAGHDNSSKYVLFLVSNKKEERR
jgi:hypothetical protein